MRVPVSAGRGIVAGRTAGRIAGSAVVMMAMVMSACAKSDTKTNAEDTVHAVPATIVAADPKDAVDSATVRGLPPGYVAQLDVTPDTTPVTTVTYTAAGSGRWDVTAELPHLLYGVRDSVRAPFTVEATFEQQARPARPEGFGVFWGGTMLHDAAKRRAILFLVRGDGMYSVQLLEGSRTRVMTDWTAHPGLPKQDATGRALYGIKVDAGADAANVSVNGVPVATVPVKVAPFTGVAGVRIGARTHVLVTPLSLTAR